MMSLLSFIEIEPLCNEKQQKLPANASVIWLHGLGASGHDFEMLPQQMNLPKDASIRFIFPHAPQIPVTVNGGYVMPAWYDILEMSASRKINAEQLQQSAANIHALIDRERDRGVSAERILVIGFSQGGAVAYHAALTYAEKLAGVVGLSTYFPTSDSIACHASNTEIPILVCHGTRDPMVLESLGKKARADLMALGYQPDYKHYPIEHEVCQEEVSDISSFIQQQLKSRSE